MAPRIIGHRGASGEYPGNTLEAIAMAVEQGADVVEVDVRASHGGTPVAVHDATVKAFDRGMASVNTLTPNELAQLDLGRGEGIPRLIDVFTLTAGRVGLILDMKEIGVTDKVVEMVKNSGRTDDISITAFDTKILLAVKHRYKLARCGLNIRDAQPSPVSRAQGVNSELLVVKHELITRTLIRDAIMADMEVYGWTVNNVEELARLLDLRIHGVITDFPGKIVKACKAYFIRS